MINNILELRSFLTKDAEKFSDPMFRENFIITEPGMSPDKIALLKQSLGALPDSYTRFLRDFEFSKVSIGSISISPDRMNLEGIFGALITVNTKGYYIPRYFFEKYGLVIIGAGDAFTYCVATAKSPYFKSGEIILVDENILYNIDNPSDNDIQRIAKDFEEFLIIGGNLNQIQQEIAADYSNYDQKKEEFFKRLELLNVSTEYFKGWLSVFL